MRWRTVNGGEVSTFGDKDEFSKFPLTDGENVREFQGIGRFHERRHECRSVKDSVSMGHAHEERIYQMVQEGGWGDSGWPVMVKNLKHRRRVSS